MKKVADVAAYLFVIAVVVLSAISILGVWEFFSDDVISKSFQSIGLLAAVAVIVMVADNFIEQRNVPVAGMPVESNEMFKSLRIVTLSTLILSVALLALLGLLAIWEILAGEVLHKSLTSIAIVGFSSLVVVITCLGRENNPMLSGKKISGSMVVLSVILIWVFISFFLSIL